MAVQTVWKCVFFLLAALWIQRDAKENRSDVPFDFGFLVYIFLPFALPYYLVRSRGGEGFVTALGFFGLYFLPYILGMFTYVYFT